VAATPLSIGSIQSIASMRVATTDADPPFLRLFPAQPPRESSCMADLITQTELVRRITEEVVARLSGGAPAAAHDCGCSAPASAPCACKHPKGAGSVSERAEDEGRCEIYSDPEDKRTLDRGYVPIGVSARHCHVTEKQVETLFGPGAKLEPMKPLKQPGQFASKQLVSVVGPRGRIIERIRILGPARNDTQVELSLTDCVYLGIDAPVRPSGEHHGSTGALIVGPAGHLAIDRGVIRANRHVHLHTSEAAVLGLKDKDTVLIKIDGDRPVIYYDVQVRARPDFSAELHLDTDDANAIGLEDGALAQIIRDVSEIPDCGCMRR